MGRKRRLDIGDPELTIREMVIRHNIDPVERMLAMVKETIAYPDEEFIEENPGWVKMMLDDGYAPYIDETTGKKRLRMAKRMQVDILKSIAPFMYPSLKATESKETKDWNINVAINYGGNKEPKKIEVQSTVVPPEDTPVTDAEEIKP